jgi:hypothetical protein
MACWVCQVMALVSIPFSDRMVGAISLLDRTIYLFLVVLGGDCGNGI